MSRTKAVHVRGRLVWMPDDSHDIVLAHMVEAAERRELPTAVAGQVDQWRVGASIPDVALTVSDAWPAEYYDLVTQLVDIAAERIRAHGDVEPDDLRGWSVLDGVAVSDGFLRADRLPAAALLDVVDGLREMLGARLAPDPPGGAWLLGTPTGERRAVPMTPC